MVHNSSDAVPIAWVRLPFCPKTDPDRLAGMCRGYVAQFAFVPEALTTSAHLGTSAAISFAKASGVPPLG